MKVFSPFLNGNTTTSGSLTLPRHPISSSITNPNTGSIYHDTTDNVVKVYTGNAWEIVGVQTAPAPPPSTDIDYLVIAGGGAGGGNAGTGYSGGGGGGAGGLLSSSLSSVISGSSFTVTVGGGSSEQTQGTDSSIAGSTITTITATGGGFGGKLSGYGAGDGGSGGGAPGWDSNYANAGGSGTVGQGNNGGRSYAGTSDGGAGGGGAGQAGSDAESTTTDNGAPGGDGLQSNITGTPTYYAGGGGGGGYYSSAGAAGGSGGGGTGAGGRNNAGSPTSGTANTGGGGGGAGEGNTTVRNGGSGVAIFAYDSASFNCAGGIVGDAGNGRKYNQFNASDTLKVGSTSDFQIHTSNLVMHVDAGNFASRNGNTTGIDLSTYSNNLDLSGQSGGSLTNNPWWNCDGTGGLADFERNGVSMASNVAHTGYGSFTGRSNLGWCIDFWIKTTASGGWASGGKTIIGRNSGDIYGNITIYNNKANWNHWNLAWLNESSTTSINDGSWHHCAFNNHSNETIDIWVDGVKENDGAASAISNSAYFKLDSLGRGYNGENTAMDIGQIRVYDATLTDAQISQNYQATKTNFV